MVRHLRFYPPGSIPQGETIWVFASELQAIPARGDARIALNHFQADPRIPTGRTGQAYGIAVKDTRHQVLPIADIQWQVRAFLAYANSQPHLDFLVTRLGSGMRGLEDRRIAPLFARAPSNCSFSELWRPMLEAATTN